MNDTCEYWALVRRYRAIVSELDAATRARYPIGTTCLHKPSLEEVEVVAYVADNPDEVAVKGVPIARNPVPLTSVRCIDLVQLTDPAEVQARLDRALAAWNPPKQSD